MMKVQIKRLQKGIGLIEILITIVMIAVGLLAVASLQSGLMSESGANKARTEALVLAEQKLEEFRNNLRVADYDAVENTTVGTADSDTVAGTNANFTREWLITDVNAFHPTGPKRKRISVKISWGAGGMDETVNVSTEMSWVDPAKTAIYAGQSSGGTAATPSPRQNASEDAASEKVLGTDLAIIDLNTATIGTAGVDAHLGVDPENDGSYIILSQVASGSHYYTATNSVSAAIETGVIAVFLCSDADNDTSTADTCTHIQNHFGGVVLRHTGTVYSSSSNGLSHILVAWTSSEVNACYNATPGTTTTPAGTLDSMEYECIFAGNCDATPSSERTRTASGTGSTNETCFVETVVSNADILKRNVGPGGEFGDVGLLGVIDKSGSEEKMCFLEDTASTSSPLIVTTPKVALNEDYLLPVTKRFYVTRRIYTDASSTGNLQRSEGINRSYTNQNFLLIDRKDSCHDVAIDHGIELAPRNITRLFNESATNNNNVLSEFRYPGISGEPVVTSGTVSGTSSVISDLRLYIREIGSCYVKSDVTAYACIVPIGTLTSTTTTSPSGDVTTKVEEIDMATGNTTTTTTVNSGTPSTTNTTTSPTATIAGGSAGHPDPTVSLQSFAECSPLPSGGTCNWATDF